MRFSFSILAMAILTAGTIVLANLVQAQQVPPHRSEVAVNAVPQNAAPPSERDAFVNRLNANTVTLVSGNPNGTYLSIAYDISAVLDDGDNLRVLPVIGKGGGQNVKDILYLRGVDMGITQSNILRYFNETGEVGKNIENRMRYIARLYNEEMHVLARVEINSLQDLKGKKVNFSDIGSGTQTTSRLIFKDLKLPVQEVNMGQADAFEALKKGEIDATILIAGKPTGAFTKLTPNPAYKLIPVTYTPELFEQYLPTKLTNDDYPNMIPKDQPIDTIAVSAVLAVFNWPANSDRYRRVAKFTEAFFANFDKFLDKPRHPKWKEVNLAAELPGWTRFGAAQEILDREKTSATSNSSSNTDAQLKQAFEEFLAKLSPNDSRQVTQSRRDELFAKFLEWHKTQNTAR
jgi:TRAP transporter TAXI family solute receptor